MVVVHMRMSNCCLQSWRDGFGELSVGLRGLGVIDAWTLLRAKDSIYGLCSGGTVKIAFISLLARHLGSQLSLYLNDLSRPLYLPLSDILAGSWMLIANRPVAGGFPRRAIHCGQDVSTLFWKSCNCDPWDFVS